MNDNKLVLEVFDPVLLNLYMAAIFMTHLAGPTKPFYLPLEEWAEASQLIGEDFERLKPFKLLYTQPIKADPTKGTIYFENGPQFDLNFKEQWILSKQGQRRKVNHILKELPEGEFATLIQLID